MTTKMLPLALAAVLLVTSCSGAATPPATDTTSTTTTVSTTEAPIETTTKELGADDKKINRGYFINYSDYVIEVVKITELDTIATSVGLALYMMSGLHQVFEPTDCCTINGVLSLNDNGDFDLALATSGKERDLTELAEHCKSLMGNFLSQELISDVFFSAVVNDGKVERCYVQVAEPTAENIQKLQKFANISEKAKVGLNTDKWKSRGVAADVTELAGELVGTWLDSSYY